MAYEPMETLIPNITMSKYIDGNGDFSAYIIEPNDGYVLHDNALDCVEYDPNTMQPLRTVLGYSVGLHSCGASYDFATQQMTAANGQIVTAYGSREFYAIPSSEVPSDQIFGGGDNDHNREHEERLAKEAEETTQEETIETEDVNQDEMEG